ncbi:MAG: peptide chain release factor 1 [Phycisphaerae bacterium SM1_79]|nr:MAG: peptide chain release factor 1 [Phycisphaerae bacterium SM1_79]
MAEQNRSLLAKLDQIEAHYSQIEKQIADPAIAGDSARLIALSKEQGKLKAMVTRYREYKRATAGIEEAEQMLGDSTVDEDFRALAKEEIQQLEDKKKTLLEEITSSLVMADDMDIDSVIMEIRAGTGGEEAALFARDLYGMYVKYAEDRKWKIEQLDFSATEKSGFREVIFSVKGPGAWSELGYEGGGHRVQRVPQTESQGRIHTSAATVAVLPEPEELDIQIADEDVVEHVSRSSGPGGQSVNKLSSAVKLEHIPTGISVSMQDEKSQHKNRAKAWRILRSRVYEYHQSKIRAERDSQRKSMIGSGDRSQKIRTYNFPQNRVTDHRINLSLYSLDKIMAGDMGELIAALKDYDKEQRLNNL